MHSLKLRRNTDTIHKLLPIAGHFILIIKLKLVIEAKVGPLIPDDVRIERVICINSCLVGITIEFSDECVFVLQFRKESGHALTRPS